ncbi:tetratricopeptide repeat protein [Piscinibacterium candidicorallinum]|uniref:Tetratricopeptide repeat protein n=1 Tax=Piscinibacterium candidicorallinum TaxID=1793872 RepID=A0ABV7H2C9_9BURK
MKLRATALACALAAGFALSAPVLADEMGDIQRMMRAGQLNEALQRVDAGLATRPKDAQLRFARGLILTEQKRTNDAINVFLKLTEDFPELPEPYNNLAVLYGSMGQYDKARAALEMAIRTHPSYATAHENLGDVYARLASQSYDKALQLDSGNTGAQVKLSMIRELIGGRPAARTAVATAPAPVAAAPAARPAAPAPVAAAPVRPAAPVPAPAPAAKAAPAPAPVATAPAGGDAATKEVLDAVNAWASAWSSRDVDRYLAAYAADFKPPRGTRASWATERRQRIEGKQSIKVTVVSPVVTLQGDTARVNFRQRYDSDRLDVESRKTLVMVKTGGRWLIREERSGG